MKYTIKKSIDYLNPRRVFLLLGFLVAGLCAPLVQAEDHEIAIINARILDGNGEAVIEKGTVVIQKGSIKALGKNIKPSPAAQIIDAAGKTVMPGLADMHIHLAWAGEKYDFLNFQWRLNAYLYAGVTTAYDLGSVLPFIQQIKQEIDVGKRQGPHLHYVGPLIDSVDPRWPEITRSISAEAQAPGIASYLKRNGASAIKAYAKLNRAQVFALVRAGRKEGIPVILDAWAQNGAFHHITTGINAFAHTPREVTDHTLGLMKRFKTKIISTRAVGGVVSNTMVRGKGFLENALIKNVMPAPLYKQVQKDSARVLADKQYAEENFSLYFHKKLQATIKTIYDAGIPLIAGTDDTLFPGDSLHYELELLVDAGLTPMQAIQTATKNAANLVGEGDQWGTLDAGKRADILIIDGKPDQTISHSRNIHMVIKAGKVIDRTSLVQGK